MDSKFYIKVAFALICIATFLNYGNYWYYIYEIVQSISWLFIFVKLAAEYSKQEKDFCHTLMISTIISESALNVFDGFNICRIKIENRNLPISEVYKIIDNSFWSYLGFDWVIAFATFLIFTIWILCGLPKRE